MGNGNNKIWENVIVFVLLGIIAILLTPIIQGVFFNSQLSGAKSSTESIVRSIEVLYEKNSLIEEIVLPFRVVIKADNKYDVYENATLTRTNQSLDTKGRKPDSGEVIIDREGHVYAQNVRYGNIICNMDKRKIVTCAFKQ